MKRDRSLATTIAGGDEALKEVEEELRSLNALRRTLIHERARRTPEGLPELPEQSLAEAYQVGTLEVARVVAEPDVLGGKPCLKGTRIPIALVLRYVARGDDPIEELEISREDVNECLEYAAVVCDLATDPGVR